MNSTHLIASEAWSHALGRIASGLHVVTTGANETKAGFLASWVMQAGFEPPMVSVAVGKNREILDQLRQNGHFVLNVIPDGANGLLGRFGKYRPDAFDGLQIEENTCGVVIHDALASLDCRITGVVETGGDHVLLLAEITGGQVLKGEDKPWVHLRKNGLSY